MTKIDFTNDEIVQLRELVESELNNGLRVVAENPYARLLVEEWAKVIKKYKHLLEKLK